MKKLILLLVCIIVCTSLFSCSKIDIITSKKPNNYYYTNLLSYNISSNNNFKCMIVDTNFYKEEELNKNDSNVIINFFKTLNKENFINKPKDLANKPLYKMFFIFKKDKYVINVYNKRYISIYPWDGKYSMDYIDMSKIVESYNLFNLCIYTIPQ